MLVDLVDDRLDASPLALVAGAEDLAQYAFQHAFLYRYSPCELMYPATASVTNPWIERPDRTRSRISVDDTSMRRVGTSVDRRVSASLNGPAPSDSG